MLLYWRTTRTRRQGTFILFAVVDRFCETCKQYTGSQIGDLCIQNVSVWPFLFYSMYLFFLKLLNIDDLNMTRSPVPPAPLSPVQQWLCSSLRLQQSKLPEWVLSAKRRLQAAVRSTHSVGGCLSRGWVRSFMALSIHASEKSLTPRPSCSAARQNLSKFKWVSSPFEIESFLKRRKNAFCWAK